MGYSASLSSLIGMVSLQGNPGSDGPPGRDGQPGHKVSTCRHLSLISKQLKYRPD